MKHLNDEFYEIRIMFANNCSKPESLVTLTKRFSYKGRRFEILNCTDVKIGVLDSAKKFKKFELASYLEQIEEDGFIESVDKSLSQFTYRTNLEGNKLLTNTLKEFFSADETLVN